MDEITVAVSQSAGRFAEPEAALRVLDVDAARARANGAHILVLPELFLTGYNLGRSLASSLAEPANGRLIEMACSIAQRNEIALVIGYPERTQAGVANAAMLISDEGDILLNYRKVHLFGALDRTMFDIRGEAFPVAAYRGWRVGLAICYDIEITETARLIALAGADCLLVPTALMTPYDIVPNAVIPARAYENQLYLAYANHSGVENDLAYIGRSCICGPDGTVLAAAGTESTIISARFSRARLAEVRARDPLLADRRPELYRDLAS